MVVSMWSLNSVSPTQERPRAVVAVVAACGLLGAIAFAFFVLLLAGRLPLSAGASLLGGGLEQLGPLAFLLYSVVLALLAVALWRRWRGARRATIVLAAAGIALAIPAISSAVVDGRTFAIAREGLQIMVRVIIIFYLSQEPVKDWFASS
jgi:hypothetical protein